jgi:hypothetical protein
MPINKYDKTFYPNSEITGVNIRFYHLSTEDHAKGGDHKFGIETVLPEIMREGVDWKRCLEDEEYRKSFASDSLMMHVDCMEKSLAMHPDCIEVTDFFGRKHDVSGLGLDTLLEPIIAEAAQAQYEDEKARGIIPHDMSLEEWRSVVEASPEGAGMGVDLDKWNPKGPGN